MAKNGKRKQKRESDEKREEALGAHEGEEPK